MVRDRPRPREELRKSEGDSLVDVVNMLRCVAKHWEQAGEMLYTAYPRLAMREGRGNLEDVRSMSRHGRQRGGIECSNGDGRW